MKRFAILTLTLAGLAVPGFATIDVDWTMGGAVGNENATAANVASELVPAGTVSQLIWAGPNNMVDPVNLGSSDLTGGDDQLLASQNFNQAGGFSQPLVSASYDVPGSVGGSSFIYSRVFNDTSLGTSTYYYDTRLIEATESAPGVTPVPVDITAALDTTSNDFRFNGVPIVVTDLPMIPEPNTLAFLGLGGLLLLGFRRWRS